MDYRLMIAITAPWRIGLGLAAAAIIGVVAKGFWIYRAALTWPTADGVITRIDIERKNDGVGMSGHYFRATFTYDFRDPQGRRASGSWYKNFSNEAEAKEFGERELAVGKKVVVRFDPGKPERNDLELDSWMYTGDRPNSLDV